MELLAFIFEQPSYKAQGHMLDKCRATIMLGIWGKIEMDLFLNKTNHLLDSIWLNMALTDETSQVATVCNISYKKCLGIH